MFECGVAYGQSSVPSYIRLARFFFSWSTGLHSLLQYIGMCREFSFHRRFIGSGWIATCA